MTDKVEEKSINFDEIFEGSQKPSICLDCSYLENNEKEGTNKVTIDYEDSDDDTHGYTVRKFSTSYKTQKVVDEGQGRISSLSRDNNHPPLFCAAVLGSSYAGKTSLCYQFTTSNMIHM